MLSKSHQNCHSSWLLTHLDDVGHSDVRLLVERLPPVSHVVGVSFVARLEDNLSLLGVCLDERRLPRLHGTLLSICQMYEVAIERCRFYPNNKCEQFQIQDRRGGTSKSFSLGGGLTCALLLLEVDGPEELALFVEDARLERLGRKFGGAVDAARAGRLPPASRQLLLHSALLDLKRCQSQECVPPEAVNQTRTEQEDSSE